MASCSTSPHSPSCRTRRSAAWSGPTDWTAASRHPRSTRASWTTPSHGKVGTFHDATFTTHARYLVAPILCKQQSLGWIAVGFGEGGFAPTDLDVLSGVGLEVGAATGERPLEQHRPADGRHRLGPGLLNHRAIQQRFDLAFEEATEQGESLTVLMSTSTTSSTPTTLTGTCRRSRSSPRRPPGSRRASVPTTWSPGMVATSSSC